MRSHLTRRDLPLEKPFDHVDAVNYCRHLLLSVNERSLVFIHLLHPWLLIGQAYIRVKVYQERSAIFNHA